MQQNSGPHQSSWGKRLAKRKFSIVRSVEDQDSARPSGVSDQFAERMREAISPSSFTHPIAGRDVARRDFFPGCGDVPFKIFLIVGISSRARFALPTKSAAPAFLASAVITPGSFWLMM